MNDFNIHLAKGEFIRGNYAGYRWLIIRQPSMGHLCGYVRLWRKHPLEKLWETEEYPWNQIDIDCHGGLTFSEEIKEITDNHFIYRGFTPGYWIGWDYAHSGDYIDDPAIVASLHNGKNWTETEVMDECKNVIDQLNNKYPRT